MHEVRCATRFHAPPERVFESITDIHESPHRIDAITDVAVLTDGPVGVGTRWLETRTMFGKEATEELEIVAFDPPHGYAVVADSFGTHYDTRFDVRPDGDETIVEVTFQATPTTFLSKLMSPLGKLMMNSLKKCVLRDLEDLKRHAEGTDRASGGEPRPG